MEIRKSQVYAVVFLLRIRFKLQMSFPFRFAHAASNGKNK
jgi:hypothetical protein